MFMQIILETSDYSAAAIPVLLGMHDKRCTLGVHMCAGVIVMQLHAGNAEQAWQSYQDFLDVEEFSASGEAYAVENLLEAYCSGDAELIQKKTSSGSCWRALDASVRFLPDFWTWLAHAVGLVGSGGVVIAWSSFYRIAGWEQCHVLSG